MATSKSPHPLLRNPFQRPALTPGPLGHNDFASPDSPREFVGDTPGPLGRNDHADPSFMTTMKKMPSSSRPGPKRGEARKPAMHMSISDKGVRFIWNEEYVPGISERLHWPRGASGVTLGAGYDMKGRSRNEIVADLTSVGLSKEDSEKAAEGAGLKGDEAEEFVYRKKQMFSLSEEQGKSVLKGLSARRIREVNLYTGGKYHR